MSYQITILSYEEKMAMELISRFKGGELRKRNRTLYFIHPNVEEANAYDNSLLDFIIDWGKASLVLTPEQSTLVKATGLKNFVPLQCEFKNGKIYDYCELRFSYMPPPADWFENRKPEWHYINDVRNIIFSPQAVPKDVQAEITRVEKHNKSVLNKIQKLRGNLLDNPGYEKIRSQIKVAVVQDKSGQYYKLSQHETFIYSRFIDARTLTIVKNPTLFQIESAKELALIDYNERGNVKPPFPTVYIFADAANEIQ